MRRHIQQRVRVKRAQLRVRDCVDAAVVEGVGPESVAGRRRGKQVLKAQEVRSVHGQHAEAVELL